MSIPKRLKRPRMNVRESSVIRCQSHLQWVRGCECAIAGLRPLGCAEGPGSWRTPHICEGRIEAHHVREGDHGQGMGQKPDDSTAVPLCSSAHKGGHQMGWKSFERKWQIDLSTIAGDYWNRSPAGRKYRANIEAQKG